jgi:cystathionine beta-synthase
MFKKIFHAIGNTPLVQIEVPRGKLFAKLEYLNPGGSVKDRSALFMIEMAEKEGKIQPGGTIIDASSGNQGIATAMIGAAKGYNVIICVSEKISTEKLETLKAFGAQVEICPNTNCLEDPNSYHSKAMQLHKQTPNSFMPNQYFNIANAQAHYSLLGPEIWRQTEGNVTHYFAASGTGGTVSGAGRFLKEQNRNIKVLAMDSINSYRATNGNPKPYNVDGMGMDFISPVFDETIVDEIILIKDEQALPLLKKLAHEYGMLVGPSSAAVAWAGLDYAHTHFSDDDLGVMIFGDSGRAYLSKHIYAKDKKNNNLYTIEKKQATTEHQ